MSLNLSIIVAFDGVVTRRIYPIKSIVETQHFASLLTATDENNENYLVCCIVETQNIASLRNGQNDDDYSVNMIRHEVIAFHSVAQVLCVSPATFPSCRRSASR